MIFNQTLAEGTTSSWPALVILGVFFVLMIVMTIVPQKKRQKQTQAMMDNLSVGDKVMTIGRLIGKIVAIDNENKQVTLNVGTDDSETLIVIDRNAIGYVIDGKYKTQVEAEKAANKEKKPNLGIKSKKNDADETSTDTSAEDTQNISIESKEDISIDNKEDISIENDDNKNLKI